MYKIFEIINQILNILIIIGIILAITVIIIAVNNLVFGFIGIQAVAFVFDIAIGFFIGRSNWFNELVNNILDS